MTHVCPLTPTERLLVVVEGLGSEPFDLVLVVVVLAEAVRVDVVGRPSPAALQHAAPLRRGEGIEAQALGALGLNPETVSTQVVARDRHASFFCAMGLVAAGIEELLEVRIDGIVAAEEKLAGKPAPDTYLAAAKKLGVEPAEAAVFEDALAGVESGRAGGFGCVVGVNRVGQAEALAEHGATVVVDDLAELLDGR